MMKRFSVYALALCLSVGVWGSRPRHVAQGLDWHEDSASGIAYWCDDKTGEAEVADWYDEEEEVYDYYSQTALFVPAEFVLNYGGASMGGEGGGSAKTYKVTALGTYAFRKAAASKLEFETPSNLRTVKAFALTQMQNLKGTLVLPECVETIEHDGIGGTGMPTHKVVLPSTLTERGLSAIVLTAADTLEFLGDVPPLCTTAASGDAVNPWTSAAGETAKDIVVIVPDGKRTAYMAQEGLGDWFTNIREKSDNTTATVQATADGMQSRSGVWSLTGVYIGSASVAASLPHGVYVINGRKTIK